MAAAHTATLTHEGEDTLIRIKGHLDLPDGPLLVQQQTDLGTLTLVANQGPDLSWDSYFALLDTLPHDEDWHNFMKTRPGNEPPVDRDLSFND